LLFCCWAESLNAEIVIKEKEVTNDS
jgi:hypothetical protein